MTCFRFAAGTATASLVTMLLLVVPAQAAGQDYRFDVVQVQPAGKDLTDVTVKLTHVPDGKAVVGAAIFQTRVDMAPSGMGEMAGKWALTLTAKVQGERDTVRGTVAFDAK
jgi:hypothetical protein